MGIFKKAGALGIAKLVYDQARKPENQARLRQAVDQVKARRDRGRPR
ncbi:hypothetical protein [Aeromicrobium phragmitis]|nr:hypothetical protein [Aeromicrobium phragmitis]